jgi:general stress protein YciG
MAHENVNAETRAGDNAERKSTPNEDAPQGKKSNRGFASMDPAKQREIASKGGRAAHEKGTAHQFSANEAREAGKKGGGTVSQDRHHMAEIGRIGGQARGRKQRASAQESASSAGRDAGSAEEKDDDEAVTLRRSASETQH